MPCVFGLIRFSFLTLRDNVFRQGRERPLERRAGLLFEPRRMEQRFALFGSVCLPSLLAQPDEEFCGVVLASTLMPEPYKRRLLDLTSDHPNLIAAFEPPGPVGNAFNAALRGVEVDAPMKATFRLDDDDAISSDYTDQVRPYLREAYAGHVLSLPRGYEVAKLFGRPRVWTKEWTFGSAGLALIAAGGAVENVYYCGHHLRVSQTYPTIVDGRSAGYLMTSHGGNISSRRIPLRKRYSCKASLSVADAASSLSEKFPFLADVDWSIL